ncbi:MAG TPA: phosphonate C-P lyase system protein PhnH [Albitalea sp.]|nr:phosphonate C-P lyase system protein PhnH [Albitalea sp.]
MSALLVEMTPGFADAAHGAQQVFRVLLDAMARPGRIHTLPAAAVAGIVPPAGVDGAPMGRAAAASLLTLLDAETTLHLHGDLARATTIAWLRFHTGVRLAAAGHAAFVAARAGEVDRALCDALDLGSDEAPQRGATLLVEVDALDDRPIAGGAAFTLRGPGIEDCHDLAVAGVPDAVWAWRLALRQALPRGVDLVLTQGDRLAALPRTTRITRKD